MQPLTRLELDEMQCDNPECDHHDDSQLFINSVCHPDTYPQASYDRTTGVLTFSCPVCNTFVTAVVVKENHDRYQPRSPHLVRH